MTETIITDPYFSDRLDVEAHLANHAYPVFLATVYVLDGISTYFILVHRLYYLGKLRARSRNAASQSDRAS